MPKDQSATPRLPRDVQRHLETLTKALARKVAGEDALPEIAEAIASMMQAAERATPDRPFTTRFSATFPQIIASRVRALRTEAGWTQQQLADAMTAIGFDWKRMTVTEIERPASIDDDEEQRILRKVSYEELLATAALFGVPAIELLLPDDDTDVALPRSRDLDTAKVRELLVGRGGEIGDGGADWLAPLNVWAHEPIERPAAALWKNRDSKR